MKSLKVGDVVKADSGEVFPNHMREGIATIKYVDEYGHGYIMTVSYAKSRNFSTGKIANDGIHCWVVKPYDVSLAKPRVVDDKNKKRWCFDNLKEVEVDDTNCCGIKEINGLGDPIENVVSVYEYGTRFGAVLITDKVSTGKGKTTVDFIRRYKLGKVVSTPEFKNPNTGNVIRAWIWLIDRPKLNKFINDNVEM